MSQRTPVHALSMFWCYIDGFYLGLFRTSNAHVLAYAVIIEFFFSTCSDESAAAIKHF